MPDANRAGANIVEITKFHPDSKLQKASVGFYYKSGDLWAQMGFDFKNGGRLRLNFDLTHPSQSGISGGVNAALNDIVVCGIPILKLDLVVRNRIGLSGLGYSIGLQATISKYGKFQTQLFGSSGGDYY